MQADTLEVMLGEMIDCGREFERRTRAGERYAFANLLNALREIERGTHRPIPAAPARATWGFRPTASWQRATVLLGTKTARWEVCGTA